MEKECCQNQGHNLPGMQALKLLALLMVVIALGSYSLLNFAEMDHLDNSPATISVSGEGEEPAVPDIGKFSFSVNAEGANAAEAQEISGTKINDILAYLREQGIEDKDIKTENYRLNPRWTYEDKACPIGQYCPRERVQDGFEVSQTVSVKVRDTEQAPGIISGVGERGATNISGLDFTIDDVEALREIARKEAIDDAKEKAEVLAAQLGVSIVGLASYHENNVSAPYFERAMFMDVAEDDGGFGGAELPVGEEDVTVRVNVTYEVR